SCKEEICNNNFTFPFFTASYFAILVYHIEISNVVFTFTFQSSSFTSINGQLFNFAGVPTVHAVSSKWCCQYDGEIDPYVIPPGHFLTFNKSGTGLAGANRGAFGPGLVTASYNAGV